MKTPSLKSLTAFEDKKFLDQFNQTYEGFYKEPQSMKMLSIKLNIDRSSICWFCRTLRQKKQLGIAKKALCRITKRRVNFYTTNPALITPSNQLNIFDFTKKGGASGNN